MSGHNSHIRLPPVFSSTDKVCGKVNEKLTGTFYDEKRKGETV